MGIVKRKITFFLFAKVAANNYMTGNIFKFNKIALSLQWKKPLEYTRKRQYIYDFISLSYIITHGLVTGCLVCIKIVHVYRACNTQIVYHFITSLGVKLNIYHNHEILQLFSTFFVRIKDLYMGKTTQLFLCTLIGLFRTLVLSLLTCAHFAAFFNCLFS